MKGKTIAQRYDAMSAKPNVVTIGGECGDILASFKVPPSVFPSFDEVSTFFKQLNLSIASMDQNAMACAKREIAALSRATKDVYTKKLVADGRRDVIKRMDIVAKKNERKTGTTLKIATPRKFEEFW